MRLLRAAVWLIIACVAVVASTTPAAAQSTVTISIHLTLGASVADWASQPPIGPAANAQFRVESTANDGPIFTGVTDSDGRASITVPAGSYVFDAEAAGGYRTRFHRHSRTELDVLLAPPVERASLRVKVLHPCGGTVQRTAQVIVGAGTGMWSFDHVDRNDEVRFDFTPVGQVLLSLGYVYGEPKWITVAPTGTTEATMEMITGQPCPTTTTTATTTTVATTAPPADAETTTTVEDSETTTTTDEATTATPAPDSTAISAPAPTVPAPTSSAPTSTTPLAPGQRSAPTSAATASTSTTVAQPESDAGSGGTGRVVAVAVGLGGPSLAGLAFAAIRYRHRVPQQDLVPAPGPFPGDDQECPSR